MKVLLVVVISLFLACSYGDRYNDEVVVTSKGDVLILVHNVGDTYFLRKVDPEQTSRAAKLLSAPKQLTTPAGVPETQLLKE